MRKEISLKFFSPFHVSFFLFILVTLILMNDSLAQEQKKQPQALDVSVYKVTGLMPVAVELQYPGRLKSVSRVTVVARVGGILKEKSFIEGQFVNKDDLLFKIEPETYQAEYDNARALVEQAEAELRRAEREWMRIKASYEDRVASEQQRDSALSAYEQARANLEAARARLKQTEINLGYTDVRAPVSGIVGARLIDTGNMVNPGTSLTTITQIDPIYVEFSIPDTDIPKIGKTSALSSWKAELIIDGRQYSQIGKIDFIDTVIDEKTSTLSVRAIFRNSERSLLPGQFVRIRLKGNQRKAILVPQKAVMQGPEGSLVYVVEDGRAKMKKIRIGEVVGEDFIVKEGLKPGDVVITDNLMKLRPGMPVRVSR